MNFNCFLLFRVESFRLLNNRGKKQTTRNYQTKTSTSKSKQPVLLIYYPKAVETISFKQKEGNHDRDPGHANSRDGLSKVNTLTPVKLEGRKYEEEMV